MLVVDSLDDAFTDLWKALQTNSRIPAKDDKMGWQPVHKIIIVRNAIAHRGGVLLEKPMEK